MLRALIIILTSIFLFHLPSYAQVFYTEPAINIDSLEEILPQTTGGARVTMLNQVSYFYRNIDNEKSLALAMESYELAEKLDDKDLLAEAAFTLGTAYHHSGNYPMAIRYALDAFESIRINENVFYELPHVELIVLIYLFSGNADLAVKAASEFYDRISQFNLAAEAQFEFNIRMGWIYKNAYQFEDAFRYFRKAESLAGETSLVPPANIAMNAAHLLGCYRFTGNYDSALHYAYISQSLCETHDLRVLDIYLNDVVACFLAMDQLDSAAFYSRKAMDKHNESGFEKGVTNTLIQKGNIAEKKNEWASARTYYEEAIEHARWIVENKLFYKDKHRHAVYWYSPMQDVSDNLEKQGFGLLMNAHHRAYNACKILGDFTGSTYHLEQYNEAWKHIDKLEKNKEVLELNTRYETERKEQRIILLEKETELARSNIRQTRLLLFGISGFLIAILFMVLLYLRQNRLNAEQDKIVLQQQLFRSQMNPHFLYNSLASIQNFIVTEDPDNASIYLSRFSNLVRSILDSSNEEFVTLDKEIRLIGNYLALQKVRFTDKFDYTIDIDSAIDIESVMIPPMLAQPFIENRRKVIPRWLP